MMNPHEIKEKYSLRHASVLGVLPFFADSHLHPELREIAEPIRILAFNIVGNEKDGPDLVIALRKLLDARESFIRNHKITNNFRMIQGGS